MPGSLMVAVTGGIGAGKSTAAAIFAEWGAVLIDSDGLAREAVAPGSVGLASVVGEFGDGVLDSKGSLDRGAMADIIFRDPDARVRLERIIHPLVRAEFARRSALAPPGSIVVNDIPLVRTVAEAARFHLVVTIAAEEDTRVPRLIGRGLAESDARARIIAQLSDDDRRPLSDAWIDNDHDDDRLRQRLHRLWSQRIEPMAANVESRRPAPRAAPRIVAPAPAWGHQAALLAERISAACGGAPCDHIGSTAVQGLPAKDVIDLQLAVTSMDDADDLATALSRAGFPRVDGLTADNPHPPPLAEASGGRPGANAASAADPRDWQKRFHVNADPGRAVNLHVRRRGAANWRWALLFRDWLRAEPEERRAYVALKRELAAAAAGDMGRYADGKEPWLAAAGPRMEQWATATGWRPPS